MLYLCSVKITNAIQSWWRGRRNNVLFNANQIIRGSGMIELQQYKPFGDTVFYNCVGLVTDLAGETNVTVGGDIFLAASFKQLFDNYAELAWHLYYKKGYFVVGRRDDYLWVMGEDEYSRQSDSADGEVYIRAKDGDITTYVIKSDKMQVMGESHYMLCKPYVEYISAVMTSSLMTHKRMGVTVLASPETSQGALMPTTLDDPQIADLENEYQKKFGALKNQSTLMLFPQAMKVQTVSLATLDIKAAEKVRMGITAIADTLRIPANQLAEIDANKSAALSNGGEMREGDRLKYSTYKRLWYSTFGRLANTLGLPDATITLDNDPTKIIQNNG